MTTTEVEFRSARGGASIAVLRGLIGWLLLGCWAIGPTALAQEQAETAKPVATAPSGGWEALSLEQLLERAMVTHPEIVVARSKVQEAEAELKLTRFQVSREVVTLWNEWSTCRQETLLLKKLYEKRATSVTDLLTAQAKLTTLESQLKNLFGKTGDRGVSDYGSGEPAGPQRLPRGPFVEKIRAALGQSVPLEFVSQPLRDVTDFVKESCQIEIVVDESLGDLPITLTLRGTPLGAAIQAIEDQSSQISFVVRDYGILVTTKGSRADLDGLSAVDFWRESCGGAPDALQKSDGKETVRK